jgi:CBS domain-containing protein
MQVKDIMSTSLKTVKANQLVKDVALMMIMDHISGAPVVDENNKLVGVITQKDILKIMLPKNNDIMA